MKASNISVWDYLVFSMVLAISAGIGIFYGFFKGKNKTTSEFLMANRQMQILPIALSLLASFMSAITLLGVPAEIYMHGTQFMVIGFAYATLMPIVAYLYVPVFYGLELTSVYEYLELRFRKPALKYAGSVTFIFQMMLYMAIVLYAPCLTLNAVADLNLWASVVSVGVVCTFYTSLGGMKAVMWTDVFQVSIMIMGLIAVIIKGSIDMGGFSNVWQTVKEGERVEFLNFDPDPRARHTVWSTAIGGIFQWLAIYGINQSQVQRALTSPKLRNAQIAMLLNGPGLIVILILSSLCGMVAYAHFKDCDPLKNGDIIASDQVLPFYVMEALGLPGLPGLFVACIFSGSLSTISSGLNSLAAVTMQDFVRVIIPDISEKNATICAKVLAMVYGVTMMLLTVVAAQLGSVLQAALSMFGMLSAPLLGLFTLGIFFKQANWIGGVVGWIISLTFQLWIGIGAIVLKPPVPMPPRVTDGCHTSNDTLWQNDTLLTTHNYLTESTLGLNETTTGSDDSNNILFYELYRISYIWYSLIALLIVIVIGLPVSLITGGEDQKKLNMKTVINYRSLCCCCFSKDEKSQNTYLQDKNSNELATNPLMDSNL